MAEGEVYDPTKHGAIITAQQGEVYDPKAHGDIITADHPALKDWFNQYLDGLTMGAGDAAIGGVKSLFNGKKATDAIADERKATDESGDRLGTAGRVAAQVAGAGTPFLIPGIGEIWGPAAEAGVAAKTALAAPKAISMTERLLSGLKTVGKGSAEGAAYGAGSGAGHSIGTSNVSDAISNTLEGAGTGAVVGGVLKPVTEAIPQAVGWLAKKKFDNIGGAAPEALQAQFDATRAGVKLGDGADNLATVLPQKLSKTITAMNKEGANYTPAEWQAAKDATTGVFEDKNVFQKILDHKFKLAGDDTNKIGTLLGRGDNPLIARMNADNPTLPNQVAAQNMSSFVPQGKYAMPLAAAGFIPGIGHLAHGFLGTSSPITGRGAAYVGGKIMRGADKSPLSAQQIADLIANVKGNQNGGR